MEERRLTPKIAAELAEVPRSTFGEWLNGASPTDLEAVARFAQKLGVSFEYLLLGKVVTQAAPDIKEIFDVAEETSLSGLFQIEIKRLTPKRK